MRRLASSSVMSRAAYPGVKIWRMKIWTEIGRLLGRIVPILRASASVEHPPLGRKRWLKTFLRGMALGADPTRAFVRPASIFARPVPRRSLTVWEAVGDDLWNAIEHVDRELQGTQARPSGRVVGRRRGR